jgi:hypothetical protein
MADTLCMKNTLSLLEETMRHCHETGTMDRFDAYIEALARKAGLTESEIHNAVNDDYPVVLYRP